MPYTYDDFTRAAAAAGLSGSFDPSDLATAQRHPEYGLSLVSLKRDLGDAQTAEQRLLATEAMNQLRKNYAKAAGGTSGSAADTPIPLSTMANQANSAADVPDPGVQTSSTPEIGTAGTAAPGAAQGGRQYESEYERLLDQVINGREQFGYDPDTDAIYNSYKKAYNREGDRAAANALAQSAAITGGRASSWAETAAQLANNYYAAKLADIIPTLRSQALDEYSTEYTQLLQALNAAYQQERDKAADEQTEFENALRVYQLTKKITGPLADILGTASSGAGNGGGGSYGGGGSGRRSGGSQQEGAGDQELWDAIMAKYPSGIVTDASDYQDLYTLAHRNGISTADMINAGIHVSTPAMNAYQDEQNVLLAAAQARQAAEDKAAAVRAATAYMDEQAALLAASKAKAGSSSTKTKSTSGKSTGTGTIKVGTRTPSTAAPKKESTSTTTSSGGGKRLSMTR